jgi:1,4-alpha-glucan branching enzyme
MVLVVCNFNPVLREGYCMGVPAPGTYKELLNTDDVAFGGTGIHNKAVKDPQGAHARVRAVHQPDAAAAEHAVSGGWPEKKKAAGKKAEK